MARGGVRLLAGVGEGFPVVLSVVATEAGNAPGAHPGRGKTGLRGSRFRWLWVGGHPDVPLRFQLLLASAQLGLNSRACPHMPPWRGPVSGAGLVEAEALPQPLSTHWLPTEKKAPCPTHRSAAHCLPSTKEKQDLATTATPGGSLSPALKLSLPHPGSISVIHPME